MSVLSDGEPVADEEHLLRIVLAPRDAADSLPPAFEDALVLPVIGTGLSVLRDSRATAEEIVRLAKELADRAAEALPPSEVAEIIGVVRFQAKLARDRRYIAADAAGNVARRTICVYATPDQVYPSHADLLLGFNLFDSGGKRRKEAFGFSGQLSSYFITAADFVKADITGIRLAGRNAT